MIQTFTHNDLIRYAYNETTEEENQQIQEALTHEPDMLRYYLNILDLQVGLTGAKLEPSELAIKNIMRYSANHPISQIRRN